MKSIEIVLYFFDLTMKLTELTLTLWPNWPTLL